MGSSSRSARVLPRFVWLLVIAWVAVACPRGGGDTRIPADFDDHTVNRIAATDDYFRFARAGRNLSVLKFVVLHLEHDQKREALFLDGSFFELHDQWYWFRLLNGVRVPGLPQAPLAGQRFATPEAASEWARAQKRLPLELRWATEDRLYSDNFYDWGVREKKIGIGSIVHVPASENREALWAFELEYSDVPEPKDLTRIAKALKAGLPPEIGRQLQWLMRSPAQVRVAETLGPKHPLHGKTLPYSALATPGAIEVYVAGLGAGRLRRIGPDGEGLGASEPNDILLLDVIPDDLPPAAGILTSVPQTPLSHVVLLARNRGIPDAHIGGLSTDPNLEQLARVRAPVILLAEGEDVRLVPISEADYLRWRQTNRPPPTSRVRTDLNGPLTIDLAQLTLQGSAEALPRIGGKAAGFLALLAAGVEMPPHPLVITSRVYAQHLAGLDADLRGMLGDARFAKSSIVRYLVLEGPKRFKKRHTDPASERLLAQMERGDPKRDVLVRFVKAGGLRKMIRARPMHRATRGQLHTALSEHFADHAATQGLRFRSSSTVEDLEGFSGAGLYVSSTGFLDPRAATREKDKKRDIEWAIKRTWASYWGAEAFEERQHARVDHLSGQMAVLVHARFDDPLETANGVAVLTLHRGSGGNRVEIEFDSQAGAVSVTNPDAPATGGKVLPEVVLVTQRSGEAIRVERRQTSSISSEPVMDDATLARLTEQMLRVARAWLAADDARTRPAQRRRSITLDFEYRALAPGWPARRDGNKNPPRVVLKQVRPIEPGRPPAAQAVAAPTDVVSRARRIDQRVCEGNRVDLALVEILTDPFAKPDPGHSKMPFLASLRLSSSRRGQPFPHEGEMTHLDFAEVRVRPADLAGFDIRLTAQAAQRMGLDEIRLGGRGHLQLFSGGRPIGGESLSCRRVSIHAAPELVLRTLMENNDAVSLGAEP